MHTVLQMAIRYAAAGFRVVPLRARSKQPWLKNWQRRASRDPEDLHHWLAGRPDDNLGLLMGHGLFCLDVDPRRGGEQSLKQLLGRRQLPTTAETLTGSGGRHLVFRLGRELRTRDGLLPGLDLKAAGSYIVAEPSVHPCGREYVWIRKPWHHLAVCPPWLATRIEILAPGPVGPRREDTTTALRLDRPGAADALAAELIARFVVPGVGQRNDVMVRAIGRLLGRGYREPLVVEAVHRWWTHFHERGTVRTPPDPGEIRRAIHSTLRPGTRFRAATSGIDHEEVCGTIDLSVRQRELFDSTVSEIVERLAQAQGTASAATGDVAPRLAPRPPPSKRVTRIERRLCESDDERAFVEAILVHTTHKHATEGLEPLRMTHDQVRSIARGRDPARVWSNSQFQRLKAKYVRSLGPDARPASRLELLEETRKGCRAPDQRTGVPSEYRVSGLRMLLPTGSDSRLGGLPR